MSRKSISIVDVNMGNLSSVRHALFRLGLATDITNEKTDIEKADVLILPGVGSFGECMEFLKGKELIEPLQAHALEKKKPILGICLGMQLFADASEEYGFSAGLGLIPGRIVKLKPKSDAYRVPNMGWCDIRLQKASTLFPDKHCRDAFYFVHSYHFQVADQQLATAAIEYDGAQLVAAVESQNILGVQFHPEKSQDAGLNLLAAFLKFAGCLPAKARHIP